MDKKLMTVQVITKGNHEVTFADTATTSDGTSAARSLAQHTMIDAEGTVDDSEEAQRIIIPYMAINDVMTMVQSTSATAPEDDNCKEAT